MTLAKPVHPWDGETMRKLVNRLDAWSTSDSEDSAEDYIAEIIDFVVENLAEMLVLRDMKLYPSRK